MGTSQFSSVNPLQFSYPRTKMLSMEDNEKAKLTTKIRVGDRDEHKILKIYTSGKHIQFTTIIKRARSHPKRKKEPIVFGSWIHLVE